MCVLLKTIWKDTKEPFLDSGSELPIPRLWSVQAEAGDAEEGIPAVGRSQARSLLRPRNCGRLNQFTERRERQEMDIRARPVGGGRGPTSLAGSSDHPFSPSCSSFPCALHLVSGWSPPCPPEHWQCPALCLIRSLSCSKTFHGLLCTYKERMQGPLNLDPIQVLHAVLRLCLCIRVPLFSVSPLTCLQDKLLLLL